MEMGIESKLAFIKSYLIHNQEKLHLGTVRVVVSSHQFELTLTRVSDPNVSRKRQGELVKELALKQQTVRTSPNHSLSRLGDPPAKMSHVGVAKKRSGVPAKQAAC